MQQAATRDPLQRFSPRRWTTVAPNSPRSSAPSGSSTTIASRSHRLASFTDRTQSAATQYGCAECSPVLAVLAHEEDCRNGHEDHDNEC